MNRVNKVLLRAWLMLVAAVLICSPGDAWADARTEYLVMLLEKGGSYRVRVQAATTLGKLRSQDALPALVRALEDEHELVVISAATAVGQIGDPAVIGDIEKALPKAPSPAAKSQLEATLRLLKALSPEGDDTLAQAAPAEFLIRIDAMGNSSGVQRGDVTETLRDVVIRRVRQEPGVVIQEPGMSEKEVKKKLKKEKLRGFILSGSVLRMEHAADQMVVKIGLNVFSNPEYNLLMMPTAEGAVPVMSGPLTRERERAAQDQVLKAVAESLVRSVFEAIRQDL